VGPDIDLELILITARIWQELGLQDLELQLNTLGASQEWAYYHDQLVGYLRERFDELDEDSRRRLVSSPLSILDTKNPQMASVIKRST
jgi:histidyl-tRNA synthetase